MDNVTYKVLDDKGRITIPLEMRKRLDLHAGAVIRVAWNGEKNEISLSKAEVIDYGAEDPEMLETCIYAAVRTLTKERKVALAASLLSPMSEGGRR